jgi:hypothetical protein
MMDLAEFRKSIGYTDAQLKAASTRESTLTRMMTLKTTRQFKRNFPSIEFRVPMRASGKVKSPPLLMVSIATVQAQSL